MDWIITPLNKLSGSIHPPADKSITHRAIMLASISQGESVIDNFLSAQDCMCTLEAFRNMGIQTKIIDKKLFIKGKGLKGLEQPSIDLNAGNSGTTVRLMFGILSGQKIKANIIGDESLSQRPMKRIIEPLRRMGAKIKAREDNYLPMEIIGSSDIKPISYNMPIASAQVKSCILFAGLHATGLTTVKEPVKSRDHSERMLKSMGAKIKVKGLSVSISGPARLNPLNITIPGDISSAGFFLVAGAIVEKANLNILNVSVNPTRDGIIEILMKMGAKIILTNTRDVSGEPVADISIKNSCLNSVDIDSNIIPRLIDEIPIIALAATQANGRTTISGANELRIKESDRLKTITSELNKMGADIKEKDDGLIINGPTELKGAVVQSHNDHRIAMSLAIAGLIAKGQTKIKNVECVDTSFPEFRETLESLK